MKIALGMAFYGGKVTLLGSRERENRALPGHPRAGKGGGSASFDPAERAERAQGRPGSGHPPAPLRPWPTKGGEVVILDVQDVDLEAGTVAILGKGRTENVTGQVKTSQ